MRTAGRQCASSGETVEEEVEHQLEAAGGVAVDVLSDVSDRVRELVDRQSLHERTGHGIGVAVGHDVGHRLFLQGVADHVVVDGVEGEMRDGRRHVGGGECGEVVLHVPDPERAGELLQPQRRSPRVADECGSGVDGEAADGDERISGGVGGGNLGRDRIDHQGEHFGLVGDVVVQRHHLVAEVRGELAHREGVGAVLVGERDAPGDDRVTVEGVTRARRRLHP
jgi:hypothetical protein